MTPHYLEVFVQVADAQSLPEASARPPYLSISHLSETMTQLQYELGFDLFRGGDYRQLTRRGWWIYNSSKPFFRFYNGLTELAHRDGRDLLRLGGPEYVLGTAVDPVLKLLLREGILYECHAVDTAAVLGAVAGDELDCGIVIVPKAPNRLRWHPLLEVHPALLVPKYRPMPVLEDLWRKPKIDELLVCPPRMEALTRTLDDWLVARKVKWGMRVHASSSGVVPVRVACDHGLGLAFDFPPLFEPRGLRALRLTNLPRLTVGIVWRKPSARVNYFVTQCEAEAKRIAQQPENRLHSVMRG